MAIILPSGFDITNIDPIDSRFTVATQAARLGFSAANVYEGLVVFQRDTNELYVLTNTGSYNSVTGWELVGRDIATGSFATTGSNRFNGDQIISGSLSIKSTSTGSIINTINLSGSNVFQVTNAGRFIVSRSIGDSGQTVNVYGNQNGSDGMYFQNDNKGSSAGIQLLMGNDKIAASGSDNFFQIYKGSMNNYNIPDGTQIVEYGTGGIRIASFGRPSTAPSSSGPISFAIGGIGSVNEVAWVNHPSYLSDFTAKNNINILSGSLRVFNGNINVTGSIIATQGITGSLQGTSSYAVNALTASYLSGYVSPFPYTGDAVITGSLSNGLGNTIPGLYSHAEGSDTIASGSYSHTEGRNTTAIGLYSHAEGYQTTTIGQYSHAEGNNTTAVAEASHAEGQTTRAIGLWSHAEGNATTSKGIYAHSEGNQTKAIGDWSHAEGNQSVSIGSLSHAEGTSTTSIGLASHTEGQGTTTVGDHSHAEGYYTIASGPYQHVQGVLNIPSLDPYAFILGNGDPQSSNRSNLIFASGSSVQITGSLIVTNGITGSLRGTASFASTASFAPLYLPLNLNSNTTASINSNKLFFTGTTVDMFNLERITTVGNGGRTSLTLIANASSSVIQDGYGPEIDFKIKNSSSIDNTLAAIVATRQVNDSSGQLEFYTFNTGSFSRQVIITSTGEMGIGVESASLAKLQVNGNVYATSFTGSLQGTSSFASYAATASYADNFTVAGTITAQKLVVQTVTSSIIYSSGSNQFGSQLTDIQSFTGSLRVTGSGNHYIVGGNVGIGTTTPGFPLDIVGNMKATGTMFAGQFKGDAGGSTSNPFSFSGNGNIGMYFPSNINLGFSTAGIERIRIDASGSLGIGTATPNAKLDINGNAIITGSLQISASIFQYSNNASITSGSIGNIASFPTSSYQAGFFDYVASSGTNARAGTIFTVWNGTSIEFSETATNDIGLTNNLILSASLSSGNILLQGRSLSGSWSVKTLTRMI